MTELFSQFSAFTVFLSIAAVGFLFLLVSLVFGEVFGHFGDGHFDHDFSHGGPSFFSVRILSVFVTAFGGFGAVGIHYGLSTLASSGVGALSGMFFAWLIYAFAQFLFGQQATTEVRSTDIVSRTAVVVVAIPAKGLGRVRCQIGEELIDQTARTRDGAALAENSIVTVEEVLGDICIVRPQ